MSTGAMRRSWRNRFIGNLRNKGSFEGAVGMLFIDYDKCDRCGRCIEVCPSVA